MKKIGPPPKGRFFARIGLQLYREENSGITDEAYLAFDDNIDGYAWALRYNGAIVNHKMGANAPTVALSILTDDPGTVRTINKFPALFRNELTPDELSAMWIRVLACPSVDFPFWSPDDDGNEDTIIFDDDGQYLALVKGSWEANWIVQNAMEKVYRE